MFLLKAFLVLRCVWQTPPKPILTVLILKKKKVFAKHGLTKKKKIFACCIRLNP
jgi:hypothetical protein